MVKEIRLYIEGGGDSRETKLKLSHGFSAFLRDIVSLARKKRIKWFIIACGSRLSAFDNFQTALRSHAEAFNVLLVDSEGPINSEPRKHLRDRDGWDLSKVGDAQCHLMVQTMEAWIIADIAALKNFYRQGFHPGAIPKTADVEQIDKSALESSLKAATRKTQKGEYHKIRHASELLKRIDPVKVRNAAPHCRRLFLTLERKIDEQ
jgi:hypothetical protein